MSDPENPTDGDNILKSVQRLASVEEDEQPRSDRPGEDPGTRLVLTEDMTAGREDVPPLVLGGEGAEDAADTATRPAPEAGLDEAALRELVAEIVREELRGSFGERITSNIRKLVRREILRAQSLGDTE